MVRMELCRSRIPNTMFEEILEDLSLAETQYGPMSMHDNEEARSRYISVLFNRIIGVFGTAIVNKPEGLLDSRFSKRGRIEHHFVSLRSTSVVFIEVKRIWTLGKGRLDVKAQVLAECAACDFANQKEGYWTPILAVLCDGINLEFMVFDSSSKTVYTSGWAFALMLECENEVDFIKSVKRTAERLFDWFVMAYINGIRAFEHVSSRKSDLEGMPRKSTENWGDALAHAERAHWFLREGHNCLASQEWSKAEELARQGVELLKQSVSELPSYLLMPQEVPRNRKWAVCFEESVENDPRSANRRWEF
ncbi:uncharacterized protein BJX67DRAFT_360907 [Aspergillus lucknowensis]|uniref:Fungal-type protein kinase domain-containing protein n=1 Tax=Aspergillus lucknowensis TaxID=176173 RepID=A0ABR4LMF0_9EURO